MDDIRILNDNFMNGCGCRRNDDCGCERREERCCKKGVNTKGVFEYIDAIQDLKQALCELKEGQRFLCESLKKYEEGICKEKKGIEVIEEAEKIVCDAAKDLEEGLCEMMKQSMY